MNSAIAQSISAREIERSSWTVSFDESCRDLSSFEMCIRDSSYG